jgi:hypothetical protein
MATGPEHYREAERLLSAAREAGGGPDNDDLVTAAQAHATLALAAATALSGVTLTLPASNDLADGWNRAIGITRDEAVTP